MKIMQVLEGQCSFGFTGKINVLQHHNSQYLGSVFLREGKVVNVLYRNIGGIEALTLIYYDEYAQTQQFKFIIEPEVIEESEILFQYQYDELQVIISNCQDDFGQIRKLRPDNDLQILIATPLFYTQEVVTCYEFDILCIISDYKKVADIYEHAKIPDYLITSSLISLRRKGCLRVVA